MEYKNLSEKRKKSLAENARRYSETHYKQFKTMVFPELYDKFEEIREKEGLSKHQMLKKLLDFYLNEKTRSD